MEKVQIYQFAIIRYLGLSDTRAYSHILIVSIMSANSLEGYLPFV